LNYFVLSETLATERQQLVHVDTNCSDARELDSVVNVITLRAWLQMPDGPDYYRMGEGVEKHTRRRFC
jgi:hypothetical protein